MRVVIGSDGGNPAPRVGIIGAGIAGLMAAFHILTRLPQAKITVLEQGNFVPYHFGTSTRSAACTRQQFGCPHNIQMSLYSTRFYERFAAIVGERDQILWQRGYLFLHRDPDKWKAAQERVKIQRDWGLMDVSALGPDEVKKRFPFVVQDGLLGGTFCGTDGFLDPGIILTALKERLRSDGAHIFTNAEVTNIQTQGGKVTRLDTTQGDMGFDFVVNATGAWATRIANMVGTDLEVAPEKRYLWTAQFRDASLDFSQEDYLKIPFTVCNSNNGITPYLKPEPSSAGPHTFMLGCEHEVEPWWDFKPQDQDHVDPDYAANLADGFHVRAWEEMCSWLTFAEQLGFKEKVNGGFYETTKSHSPVIGFDPNVENLIHCVGFSGHGLMHGPAAGATVADLIKFGEYRLIPTGEQNLSYRSLVEETRETETMKI